MTTERTGAKTVLWLAAGIAVFLLGGQFVRHTFSALVTALVFAYLLNPLLRYLEQRGFDRLTALVLLYGIGILAFFVSSFLFIPYLGHQLNAYIESFPLYVRNVETALERWKGELAPYYAGEEGGWLVAQAEQWLDDLVRELSGSSYRHLKGLLFGLFDLILAPILVFFFLFYKEFVKESIKRLVPLGELPEFVRLGRKIDRTLQSFLRAMTLDCLLVGVLTSVTLVFLGVDFPVLNGFLAGFASIIPFLGVGVAIIPAAFIGYAKGGDLSIIPKVCIAYFLIYTVIEGNIIKPLIMRRTLRLNPLAVIFAVMALGELLGFWGVVLAVPVAALVKIVSTELRHIAGSREASA